jgi:hypothetical protein
MNFGSLVNSNIADSVAVMQLVRHALSVNALEHLLTDSKLQ